MKALGRDAKALIDAANRDERMSDDESARIRRKVMARVGIAAGATAATLTVAKTAHAAGAAASAATGSAAAPAAVATTGMSFFAKVGLTVVLVGGITTGVVVGTRSDRSIEPTGTSSAPLVVASADRPAQASTPANPTKDSVIAASAAPASSAPAAPSAVAVDRPPASARPVASAAPVAEPIDDLDAENVLIARAETALAQGRASDALAVIDEHAKRFPHGALAPEREAARVVALCAAGRTDEGRRAAAPFVANDSPLADRIRRACGMSSP